MRTDKTIYLIPYAHLDTQWRWEYPTTIKEYIKNTIHDNVALLEKYPEYCFNFTGAIRYDMMKEYYPDGFEKVKKFIQDGRWHLAGTCLDETDAVVPSVESLIRNILYGNEWQKKEFNKSSRDYMLPDCFGFPANMPTVLNHCGLAGFSTQKLTWGSAVGTPFNVGKWLGPDGSPLLCALDPGEYVADLKTVVQQNETRTAKLNSLGNKTGVWKTMQYYGVGDVGGAPQESSAVNAIKSESMSASSEIKVKQTSCTEFFNSFTDEEKSKLQEYKGDLLLTNHSAGSISSQSIMKRWNRQNEQLAFVAEYYALLAETIAGQEYPHDRIMKAWKKVIGNQMHDILPGTCTPVAYEYSYNDEVLALKEWSKIIEDSITAIAPYIEGEGNIIVINPFEYKRQAVCEIVCEDINFKLSYCLVDAQGNKFNAQLKKLSGNKALVIAEVRLNAFEIKKYKLINDKVNSEDLVLKNINGNFILENKYLKLSVNSKGEIFSLFDKLRCCEMFAKPLSYHIQKESPKEYPAWNMDWKDRQLSPCKIISQGSVRIVEDGAVRKALEITTKLNKTVLVKEISLTPNSKSIEFTERIKWREKGVSLKLALSPKISNPKCVYNWETAQMERPINHEKQFEVPSRYFADVKNQEGGIAILENCKYGYDRPNNETLRLTLLYTPKVSVKTKFYDQSHQDFGTHTIKYALYPHGTENTVDLAAKAFNRPLRGYLSSSVSNLNTSSTKINNIVNFDGEKFGALAIKKAESKKGFIIRLYNRQKIDNFAKLSFLVNVTAVYEINGIEENIRQLPLIDGAIDIEVKSNAIVSIFVETPCITKKIIEQEGIKLIGAKNLDLYPKELVGSKILSGNIVFNIGDEVKALSCEGQKIALENNFNTISLLVCSNIETNADMVILDKNNQEIQRQSFKVYPTDGYVGQFDQRKWLFPITHAKKFRRDYIWFNKYIGLKDGYVRPSKIGWYTTHTHIDNKDLYYKHGYLEQVDIPISDNAKYIVLPKNEQIKVISATQSNQKAYLKDITYKIDKYEF